MATTQNSSDIPSVNNTCPAGTGTGFTTIPYSAFPAGGSNLVSRDSHGNIGVNSLAIGTTSTAGGGTTTLTVASTQAQIITGSGNSTIVLPDATTLNNGWTYLINNLSSGNVTVNHNGGTLLATVVPGAFLETYLTSDSTSTGVWDTSWQMPSNASYGTAGLTVTGFATATGALTGNTVIEGYATTATAASTTTLTVGSAQQQYFTGTTTQTVVLPVTSTLVLGQSFTIVNNSTGIVTVESSGGNTIQSMASNTVLVVTVVDTSVTTAAGWNATYLPASGGGSGITTVGDVTSGSVAFNGTVGTTLTGTQSGLTLTVPQNAVIGGIVSIIAGSVYSLATAVGGDVDITSGNGGAGNNAGGNINITSGVGGASGPSGNINILCSTGGSTAGGGGNISIQAGSAATSGVGGTIGIGAGSGVGTNQNAAGTFTLYSAQSTGTGTLGNFRFYADAAGGTSGTTPNSQVLRLALNGSNQALVSGSAATIVTPTIPSGSMAGGQIVYTIECTNGTDYQCVSGIVAYSITNKSATISGSTSVLGTEATHTTSGTLTDTWAVTAAGLVQVTATTSLTATKFRITFTVFSNSQQNITFA